MIWHVLNFAAATALVVLLALDVRAQRRRWTPDISAGFKMTAPAGWHVACIDLRREDGIDQATVTLQRRVPTGRQTVLGDAA